MSCNPAIGGVGKGHLAKEIDAMGGLIAKAADQAAIHIKQIPARERLFKQQEHKPIEICTKERYRSLFMNKQTFQFVKQRPQD